MRDKRSMRFPALGFPALLAIAALGTGVLSGCGAPPAAEAEHAEEVGHSEGAEHGDIVLSAEAAKVAGIEIGEATSMLMQEELSVTGVVTNTAHGRAVVTPPANGRVLRINVKVGDHVREGQTIATLQSVDVAQSASAVLDAQRLLATARAAQQETAAEVRLAEARVTSARKTLATQRELARSGAFSQPALQAAEKELSDVEAELAQSRKSRAVHEAQLERSEQLFKEELISRTQLEQARLEAETDRIRQQNAEKKIEVARAALAREQKISRQGLANSREIQAAEAEVRAATLQLEQARIRAQAAAAGVKSAEKGVLAAKVSHDAYAGRGQSRGGTVSVVAPISGVITDRIVTIGQAVDRTTEICEIENLNAVWVTAQVPEKLIARVTKGAPAKVRVSAFPDRDFRGIVQVIGSRLNPKTRTMPVQVLVSNASGALRSEMFATVLIGVGTRSHAVAIARTAVLEQGGNSVIYVADADGKYEERKVRLGRVQGEFVEVLEGVAVGERVVVEGAFVLKSEESKSSMEGHTD